MTEELICTQIGNDLVVGTLKHQPEAVVVIAEEAQRFVPERTCNYVPDQGYTWWDEDGNEHDEEDSANEDCWSASCSECGYTMIVGDDGWFNGWDCLKEWVDKDGNEHKGYLLEPRFNYCPSCGAKVIDKVVEE